MADSRILQERRIRVCHVASGDLWAGAEVQIATLLRMLKGNPVLEPSAIVLNSGRLAEELTSAGISVTVYDESEAGVWTLVRALARHLTRQRPDVVHSHRYKENILSVFAAKLSHNPVLVHTYHGLEEHLGGWAAHKMRAYMRLNTMAAQMAVQGVVGVSEEITAVLKQRFPAKEVRCIRNGIDLARVSATKNAAAVRAELNISPNSFVIAVVGRLTAVKGIEYAIRALTKWGGNQTPALIIVGDGPMRASLEELAREVGIADKTLFLGARTDVYDVMAACDLLVLPSLHEGIPMVLLEAMALGVPIVASRVGGIPEILEDGQEAVLVPAENVEALASAINAMAKDSALRGRLAKSARARVESQFSITMTAEMTGELYRTLIDRKVAI